MASHSSVPMAPSSRHLLESNEPSLNASDYVKVNVVTLKLGNVDEVSLLCRRWAHRIVPAESRATAGQRGRHGRQQPERDVHQRPKTLRRRTVLWQLGRLENGVLQRSVRHSDSSRAASGQEGRYGSQRRSYVLLFLKNHVTSPVLMGWRFKYKFLSDYFKGFWHWVSLQS